METKVTHTRAPDAVESPVDRVLATVAEALVAFGDVRHEQLIMTAAVLADRHEVTPDEAVEMATYDSGPATRAAQVEADRLLDNAKAVDE